MHTNSTTNYGLSQFLGSDKPAWLVDYNGDMQKIDTAMKANADASAENTQSISDIQESIGAEGLSGRLTQVENDVSGINADLGTVPLPTIAQTITGAINEIVNHQSTQDSDINQNKADINILGNAIQGTAQLAYTIANVYDATSTYAVGDYAISGNTLYKCITAIAVGEAFDPTKWQSVKVMDEVSAGGGGGSSYSAGTGINISNNVISIAAPITATLAAGATSVTINNADITANSFVLPVASVWGVTSTNVTVSNGSVTMTFAAQANDITVGVMVLA